jgi:undecaprenyl-diphosphatase
LFEAKNFFAVSFDTRLLVYYMVGALTAFSSGLVAIRTFISLLAREKMHYFAFYCWALGLLVIFFSWKGL